MTKEEFVNMLSDKKGLVAKRCTESWLEKRNLLPTLNQFVDSSFGSISDRIRHVKYGGGWCAVCGARTKPHPSGEGFTKHCKLHYKNDAVGKPAHNRAAFNLSEALALYYIHQLSAVEVAEKYGFSNVTLTNRLREQGFELRPHQENQLIQSRRGYTKPRIIIDRSTLVYQYQDQGLSMKFLAMEYGCHVETIRRFLAQEGILAQYNRSYIEDIIAAILDKHHINYVANSFEYIRPKQIDFYLTDFNVGIECNGMYTHSFHPMNKTKDYHFSKYQASVAKGIKLFQFWEDDIVSRTNIIENIILNTCKLNRHKVGARKCQLTELDWHQLAKFCEANHLQGAPAKNVKGLGLVIDDQLVSAVGYNYQNDVTIIRRFCSSAGYNVSGGFSKLVSALPGEIIKTHSSNDISDGNLYRLVGFGETSSYKHDMWYTDFKSIINREKFMKAKLPKLLEFYDGSKTEQENMILNGYGIIYKSGTKTWVLER